MNATCKIPRQVATALALGGILTCLTTPAQARHSHHPQGRTTSDSTTTAGRVLVAAANPMAAKAGMEVLQRGGSAADAAVAIQSVLGLVEPQSSGVGGGAFLTYYDARTRKVIAYNGRETAPMGATPDMFTDAGTGRPMPFAEAVVSGRATGVPGAFAILAMAQKEHGRLAWRDLFGAAEHLADDGFPAPPRLSQLLYGHYAENARPDVIAYGQKPGGGRYKLGDTIHNPAYAETLRHLSREGTAALYSGRIAAQIVAKTHQDPLAGSLTVADLAAYRPVKSDALCRPYRVWIVCVPPPPSSGVNLLEALGILEHTDIDRRGPTDPRAWLEIAETERLMYADQAQWVGDPAFVSVPVKGLIDPDYDASRAQLIGERAGPPPAAGHPPGSGPVAADATHESAGTSHFVVVDRWGNVASMTTTVESVFGTGRMVDGFFLNNQLTDFSFAPTDANGHASVNAVAPGKRPRSSMAPVIVLDRQGRFVAALGSPGGRAILAYNLKTLVGVLDWRLSMQQAIALPNLVASGASFFGEVGTFAPGVVTGLEGLGVSLRGRGGEASGLHGVIMRHGRFDAGADSRRDGVVLTH